MASLTNKNYSTGYTEFAISGAAELGKLPTTSRGGTDELAGTEKVAEGSAAYTTDGALDLYILTSGDVWTKVE